MAPKARVSHYDVFAVPACRAVDRAALCFDCTVVSARWRDLVELLRMYGEETKVSQITADAVEELGEAVQLLLPCHTRGMESVVVHVAFERDSVIVALEFDHFEHCDKEDMVAILKVMHEAEHVFGGAAMLELLDCSKELAVIELLLDTPDDFYDAMFWRGFADWLARAVAEGRVEDRDPCEDWRRWWYEQLRSILEDEENALWGE